MPAVRFVNNGFTDFEVAVLDARFRRWRIEPGTAGRHDHVALRVESGRDPSGARAPGGYFMSVKEEQYA